MVVWLVCFLLVKSVVLLYCSFLFYRVMGFELFLRLILVWWLMVLGYSISLLLMVCICIMKYYGVKYIKVYKFM